MAHTEYGFTCELRLLTVHQQSSETEFAGEAIFSSIGNEMLKDFIREVKIKWYLYRLITENNKEKLIIINIKMNRQILSRSASRIKKMEKTKGLI